MSRPGSDASTIPLPIREITSDAICRIGIPEFLETETPAEKLAAQVYEQGRVTAYNSEFADSVSTGSPGEFERSPLNTHVAPTFLSLLIAFFEGEGSLHDRKYRISRDNAIRHFDVSLTAEMTEGELTAIWAGFDEVTDKLELEERIVTALEQQKTQLGRDIHDSVGQLLTSIRILSENLASKLPSHLEDESRIADRILEFARDAAEQLSQLEHGLLVAEEISDQGLAQALEKLARTTDSLPGISCTYDHDMQQPAGDDDTCLNLFRIVQEAVNNAVRHGAPDRIRISLTDTEQEIELTVSDDGKGFNPDEIGHQGLGLDSMRYRADVIGARLRIESSPNHGTTVRCTLPHNPNHS